MSDIFVVAYDGSPASGRALDFAVSEAGHLGASIVVAHVLEWLPYSFLTARELEERHRRRSEELERARKDFLEPLLSHYVDSGVGIDVEVSYGNVPESLLNVIKQKKATQLFVGRRGLGEVSRIIFGSVASTMAQISPVPCTVVP